jgi:hypothetical protein
MSGYLFSVIVDLRGIVAHLTLFLLILFGLEDLFGIFSSPPK